MIMLTRATSRRCVMDAGEQLFQAFVSRLRGLGVRHAFLRGYMHFPKVRGGGDVDMLIHPADLTKAKAAFCGAAEDAGFHIWQSFSSGFLTRYFSYAAGAKGEHLFFDLDMHTAEASYGVPYFPARELLEHAVSDSSVACGLSHLSAPVEALANGLGHLFMGGRIPEKYRLAWAASKSDSAARALLVRVVGERDSQVILEGLTGPMVDERRDIGARARRRIARKSPLAALLGFCAFVFGERVKPWLQPRGRFVIFAGTDGSGKTTLVRELLAKIAPRFRDGVVEEHHLRPGVIPQISSLFHGGKPAYSIEDMSDPHRSTPSGFVGSTLRTCYYWVDYFIGYPLRILPKRSRNSLIIYDRWFYDHVVDPRRFRIQQGHPLPGFLTRFLAKPDRVLVCTAPPEVVLSRKQELAPPEVARQVEAFRAFGNATANATIIDTSNDLESCVDQAITAIFGAASKS